MHFVMQKGVLDFIENENCLHGKPIAMPQYDQTMSHLNIRISFDGDNAKLWPKEVFQNIEPNIVNCCFSW